jgi:hypothetical protein
MCSFPLSFLVTRQPKISEILLAVISPRPISQECWREVRHSDSCQRQLGTGYLGAADAPGGTAEAQAHRLTLERSKTVDEEISAKVVDFLDRNDPRKTNKPFFACSWANAGLRLTASR